MKSSTKCTNSINLRITNRKTGRNFNKSIIILPKQTKKPPTVTANLLNNFGGDLDRINRHQLVFSSSPVLKNTVNKKQLSEVYIPIEEDKENFNEIEVVPVIPEMARDDLKIQKLTIDNSIILSEDFVKNISSEKIGIDQLLDICEPAEIITFRKLISKKFTHFKKVGEGVYSEVFKFTRDNSEFILKVIYLKLKYF